MSDQFGGYQGPGQQPADGGYPQQGYSQPGYGQSPDGQGRSGGGQPEVRSFSQAWNQSNNPLQRFVAAYPADADVLQPSADFLGYAAGKVPEALIALWRDHGIGFYGEQRVAVIDPGEWMGVLQTWLGGDVSSVPIALTSFGHLYHYDRVDGRDRIQCLDPHFQTNTVVSRDLPEFFNDHLPGRQSHVADLEGPRGGARGKLGPLADGEIYYFSPILALGGVVSPDSLAKGDGRQHLQEIHRAVAQTRTA